MPWVGVGYIGNDAVSSGSESVMSLTLQGTVQELRYNTENETSEEVEERVYGDNIQ